jgi:hypothetical protein
MIYAIKYLCAHCGTLLTAAAFDAAYETYDDVCDRIRAVHQNFPPCPCGHQKPIFTSEPLGNITIAEAFAKIRAYSPHNAAAIHTKPTGLVRIPDPTKN